MPKLTNDELVLILDAIDTHEMALRLPTSKLLEFQNLKVKLETMRKELKCSIVAEGPEQLAPCFPEPDLIPRIGDPLTDEVIRHRELLLKEVITKCLGEDWTREDLKKRELVCTVFSNGTQVYTIDGKSILTLQPVHRTV